MSKSMLFALLTVTGSTLNAADVFACGGRACVASCAAPSCAAPACTAPAPATGAPANGAPADPHAGTNMSQASSGSTYRSFSYEPGSSQPMTSAAVSPMTSAAVRATAPAYRSNRQPSSWYYDSVRGDKKLRGLN